MHKLLKNEKKSIFGFTNGHSVLKMWKNKVKKKKNKACFVSFVGFLFSFIFFIYNNNKKTETKNLLACFDFENFCPIIVSFLFLKIFRKQKWKKTSFCFYLQIF